MKIDKDMEPSLKSFDRFTLRIPKDLKEEATRRADSLNTSLNELVTSTLQRLLAERPLSFCAYFSRNA